MNQSTRPFFFDWPNGNSNFEPESIPPPPHNDPYNFNGRIMLTAIVSLSLVVIVVVALHIYARCVLRRQARQRAAFRSLGLTVVRSQSREPPKTGLDPMVIASLPMFEFKKTDGQDDSTAIECAVCLSMLEDQEIARLLPNCKHTFHKECIDRWLSSHSTCPICRCEAEPRPQPVRREGPVGGARPAPPILPRVNSTLVHGEGTSDGGTQSSAKVSSSTSRLSSFRRMLSRERSSRRIQSCGQEDVIEDLERQ